MKIEEAILYCFSSQNRRTSESRIKLDCVLPSEEEEDEVKCLSRLVQTSKTQVYFSVLQRVQTRLAEGSRQKDGLYLMI